jgi:hypothetical protein
MVVSIESDCDGDGQGPEGGDCDDASASRRSGIGETCDGLDNDCDALVDDTTARAAYFPGFSFGSAPSQAFNAVGRGIVLDALVGRMMASNVATEPDAAGVRSDLDALITRLAACGTSCPAGRTETIVKASCAALLGSAVTLVH